MDYPVTEAFRELMDRQGLHGTGGNQVSAGMAAGAREGSSTGPAKSAGGHATPMGMKEPGATRESAHRQLPAEGGIKGGMDMTRMRKTARYTRNGAALLMLVVSDVR